MKKPMMKTQELIVLIVFLAVITVPGILLFHEPGSVIADENRMAASFPKPSKDKGSEAYMSELETFMNDNIGFRTLASRADAVVYYGIFHKLLDPNQLQGKAGNLFPGSSRFIPYHRIPHPPLGDDELAEAGSNIEALSVYFASKDIPFLFLGIPDKDYVYPELYPDTFIMKPRQSQLQQLTIWLSENTDVDAYDLTDMFRAKAKESEHMLWYETGDAAHWNYMGAWYGYVEIMEGLKRYDPNIKALSIDEFDVSVTTEPYSNLSETVFFKGYSNTEFIFDYKPGFGCEQIGNSWDPWMPKEQLDIAGFQEGGSFFHFHSDENEGTLVFFGDSYIHHFLLPYFSETFGDVYLFHMPTNFRIMRPILDMIGADYVVMETVERTFQPQMFSSIIDELSAEVPVLEKPDNYLG